MSTRACSSVLTSGVRFDCIGMAAEVIVSSDFVRIVRGSYHVKTRALPLLDYAPFPHLSSQALDNFTTTNSDAVGPRRDGLVPRDHAGTQGRNAQVQACSEEDIPQEQSMVAKWVLW